MAWFHILSQVFHIHPLWWSFKKQSPSSSLPPPPLKGPPVARFTVENIGLNINYIRSVVARIQTAALPAAPKLLNQITDLTKEKRVYTMAQKKGFHSPYFFAQKDGGFHPIRDLRGMNSFLKFTLHILTFWWRFAYQDQALYLSCTLQLLSSTISIHFRYMHTALSYLMARSFRILLEPQGVYQSQALGSLKKVVIWLWAASTMPSVVHQKVLWQVRIYAKGVYDGHFSGTSPTGGLNNQPLLWHPPRNVTFSLH